MALNIKKFTPIAAAAALVTLALSGCSPIFGDATPNEVTVVTHDSAVFTKEVIAEFKKQTGITIKQVKAGDVGAMTNKLILTKDEPIGDLVYGIDNTFAPQVRANDMIDGALEPVDFGDVCFNFDKQWFANHEQQAPTSIKDLTKPEFKGLTVVTNPRTSSPGLAFVAATVAMFGNTGWEQYWRALKANDVKISAAWEDAYFTDFSGSSGQGAYPIVLSYSSSPAFEIRDNGQSQTASIMDGCFRQWEYAAVLKGAKNVVGAQKFIDFMLGQSFQTALPDSMYVYPVTEGIALPEAWAQFAPAATNTVGGDLNIAANRVTWLEKWSAIFGNN